MSGEYVPEALEQTGKPLAIVISGPSGVGKDALLERMAKAEFDHHFTITATTREPRPGEREGINHYFVSREQFLKMVDSGELLEWAQVYGNYYGVPKEQVQRALAAGKHALIRVDVQGAKRLRAILPEAVFVFISPPSESSLRTRLEERGVNSAGEMKRRLNAARREIREAPLFDYVVANKDGKLDQAVDEVRNIIRQESLRRRRRTMEA